MAKELGITQRFLYKWRAKLDLAETAEELARPHTREGSYRKQVRRLERLLAEKTLEVDFFKGCPSPKCYLARIPLKSVTIKERRSRACKGKATEM